MIACIHFQPYVQAGCQGGFKQIVGTKPAVAPSLVFFYILHTCVKSIGEKHLIILILAFGGNHLRCPDDSFGLAPLLKKIW